MNVIDLLARLNGEILSNKARAVVDGKIIILARMEGVDWVYTPEGQELANKHSNEAAAEVKAPRTRKAKEAVEPAAEDTPTEPVAVESGDVEPEL
jgi:hypothetical protein